MSEMRSIAVGNGAELLVPETTAHHQAQAEIIASRHRYIRNVANPLPLRCPPNADTNKLGAGRRPASFPL